MLLQILTENLNRYFRFSLAENYYITIIQSFAIFQNKPILIKKKIKKLSHAIYIIDGMGAIMQFAQK